jgi:cob(I)alamin adenosyltransferase
MGLARALTSEAIVKEIILGIQKELFLLGAELATLPEEIQKLKARITETHADRLEKLVEEYEKLVRMPRAFVPPGGTPAAGALDLARSIMRRAERRIAKLYEDGEVTNPHIPSYCNRLADLLFTLARYEESIQG